MVIRYNKDSVSSLVIARVMTGIWSIQLMQIPLVMVFNNDILEAPWPNGNGLNGRQTAPGHELIGTTRRAAVQFI